MPSPTKYTEEGGQGILVLDKEAQKRNKKTKAARQSAKFVLGIVDDHFNAIDLITNLMTYHEDNDKIDIATPNAKYRSAVKEKSNIEDYYQATLAIILTLRAHLQGLTAYDDPPMTVYYDQIIAAVLNRASNDIAKQKKILAPYVANKSIDRTAFWKHIQQSMMESKKQQKLLSVTLLNATNLHTMIQATTAPGGHEAFLRQEASGWDPKEAAESRKPYQNKPAYGKADGKKNKQPANQDVHRPLREKMNKFNISRQDRKDSNKCWFFNLGNDKVRCRDGAEDCKFDHSCFICKKNHAAMKCRVKPTKP